MPPRPERRRLYLWHAITAAVIWLVFTVLTHRIVSTGLDDYDPATVALTTAGSILGPMTGAISRNFQDCCLKFSLWLMLPCLAALNAGVAVQLFTPPNRWWQRTLRVTAWLAGLIVWFGGGVSPSSTPCRRHVPPRTPSHPAGEHHSAFRAANRTSPATTVDEASSADALASHSAKSPLSVSHSKKRAFSKCSESVNNARVTCSGRDLNSDSPLNSIKK